MKSNRYSLDVDLEEFNRPLDIDFLVVVIIAWQSGAGCRVGVHRDFKLEDSTPMSGVGPHAFPVLCVVTFSCIASPVYWGYTCTTRVMVLQSLLESERTLSGCPQSAVMPLGGICPRTSSQGSAIAPEVSSYEIDMLIFAIMSDESASMMSLESWNTSVSPSAISMESEPCKLDCSKDTSYLGAVYLLTMSFSLAMKKL